MTDNNDGLTCDTKRGRGRPKSEETYNNIIKARFNDYQLDLLEDFASRYGKSKSDIIRDAFDSYCKSKNGVYF